MTLPEVHVLHQSGFYQIRNYKCNCSECHTSGAETTRSFNFCFVRSGYFEFRAFRSNHQAHIGRVLVSKPGFEHRTHHIDQQPDICSVFDFTPSFYQSLQDHYRAEALWFFGNRDIHHVTLNCSPEIEHFHFLILTKTLTGKVDSLLLDDWVVRLVDKIMRTMGNAAQPEPLSANLKRFHLSTIKKAREFLLQNFEQDINLQQLADHCCVSLFHFSRLFKTILRVSPYQYISDLRMNHARLLLESTQLPVTQIAFQSGYNSLEHFATSFKKKYNLSPSSFRKVAI